MTASPARLATGYPSRPGAAEQYAAEHGVSRLIAPILAPNAEAVSFYSRAGFGPHGLILSKELTADGDSSTQPSDPATARCEDG